MARARMARSRMDHSRVDQYREVVPRKPAANRAKPAKEVVLTDPRAVRALAHPARLAVIDALYAGDVLTATECATLAGISASAMSYHLRALERFGIVERATSRGDGRERPWQRAGESLRISLGEKSGSSSGALATNVLLEESMRLDRERLLRESSNAANASGQSEWRRTSQYSRDRLLMSAEEARGVNAAIEKLLDPYRSPRPKTPDGAVPIVVSYLLVRENPGATDG